MQFRSSSPIPFVHGQKENPGEWPCRWIGPAASTEPPFVAGYRLDFTISTSFQAVFHVSADERYILFLDGELVGRGSERGNCERWLFDSYRFELPPGEHVLAAQVWSLGDIAPFYQMSIRHGFILLAEGNGYHQFSTGIAPWTAVILPGVDFIYPHIAGVVGPGYRIDGNRWNWDFAGQNKTTMASARHLSSGCSCRSANNHPSTHLLQSGTLPPQHSAPIKAGTVRMVSGAACNSGTAIDSTMALSDETAAWKELWRGMEPLTVAAHQFRRVIIDLDNYYCAYLRLLVSGGRNTEISVKWAEALYDSPFEFGQPKTSKGNRDLIDKKYLIGFGDVFILDGKLSREYRPFWWRCGRYLEITVRTAEEAVVIDAIELTETRYPLETASRFDSEDHQLKTIMAQCFRTVQMCAHETYMDCPYYEQMMYIGDTRIQALVTYATTTDVALPRKALTMFADSIRPEGLTLSRYPSRFFQRIPPFSLIFVAMVHDYACWRNDPATISTLLPSVRRVMDFFIGRIGADHLAVTPDGWNFFDWATGWERGCPPTGSNRQCALLNLLLIHTLELAAELETYQGEPEPAMRYRRLSAAMTTAVERQFWDGRQQCFADNSDHNGYSEHTQILALLCRDIATDKKTAAMVYLLNPPDIAKKTSIYFRHYLFEVLYRYKHGADILSRLAEWRQLAEQGFKTVYEQPEPSRSDCHAWGAHPYYHLLASVAGIRPDGFGFRRVICRPNVLGNVSGQLVHPDGKIIFRYNLTITTTEINIELPDGITGQLEYAGRTLLLSAGMNIIEINQKEYHQVTL